MSFIETHLKQNVALYQVYQGTYMHTLLHSGLLYQSLSKPSDTCLSLLNKPLGE